MGGFKPKEGWRILRRDFLKTTGATVSGISLSSAGLSTGPAMGVSSASPKKQVIVRGAFVYPPSSKLEEEGYYSWPGSSFAAESRHRKYLERIRQIESELDIRILIDENPVNTEEDASRFITDVMRSKPDGLLLIPFKKGHWERVVRIVDETSIPSVVLATTGVLLISFVRELWKRPGVYMISSQDNLDAVEDGLKMIKTASWMRTALIANIDGEVVTERTVPIIGTNIRTVPHRVFYEAFAELDITDGVRELAANYSENAKKIVEPGRTDIFDAAKTYFILKQILETEKADAIMMNCLPGLRRPHKHVPPCMGFMSLRDEGVAMGCESDLDATLTMMLMQHLFGRPGFQHNPAVDTERNSYFCAHCTSATKMHGVDGPSEPYTLRSHAEAGWGTVPRVLFKEGEEVTIAKYLSSKNGSQPQLLLYSGTILGCPPIPPTGGCRTNAEIEINELDDVTDLKGHHLTMVYGNYVKQLRTFCQLYNIEVVV